MVFLRLAGLAKNVLDPLERDRNGREIFGAAHLAHRFRARDRIHDVVASSGKHGIHHVIGEAAHIAQIELQALAHEVRDGFVEVNVLGEAGLRLRARIFRTRVGEQLADRQRQLVFGDDLHDAVGGAAQREWIFRSGGLKPSANMPAMLSALSAIASTAPSTVRGTWSSIDSGLY